MCGNADEVEKMGGESRAKRFLGEERRKERGENEGR